MIVALIPGLHKRLDALGIEVGHAVSDRAKALIKLAIEGFDCDSGADVFHEQYGLSRWLGSALGRRKVKADKHCDIAQKAVNKAGIDEQAALETQQLEAIEERVPGSTKQNRNIMKICLASPMTYTRSRWKTTPTIQRLR